MWELEEAQYLKLDVRLDVEKLYFLFYEKRIQLFLATCLTAHRGTTYYCKSLVLKMLPNWMKTNFSTE